MNRLYDGAIKLGFAEGRDEAEEDTEREELLALRGSAHAPDIKGQG
jgi:hypothetical protein